jgi:hypothetical protein
MNMVLFAQKRLFCLILMAYTALSVRGTFSFAVVESLPFITFERENTVQNKIFASLENFFIHYPAEEPILFTRLGSTRFSSVHISFHHGVSLFGSLINEKPYTQLSLIADTKTQCSDLRNNILLKLRI